MGKHSFMERLLEGVDVEWKGLGEICEVKNGYTPSKNKDEFWNNGTIPWFRMEDIRKNGRILNNSIQHVSPIAVKSDRLFPKNSIIISTTATIGEHALITVDFICNQQLTVLSIKEKERKYLNSKYLFYYSFILGDWCKKNVNPGGFALIGTTKIKTFQIPIPPLKVQSEIVRILDNFTELTAELTAELSARKKQYSYYRDTLLSFEEGEVEWRTLGEVATKISSGGTPRTGVSEYYNGTIPWLRTQEVDFCEIWDTSIKITEEGLKNSSAKIIPSNCVIVAMYGATVGKIALNKIPLSTNQACANIQLNPEIAYYRYVYHYLTSKYAYIKSLGSGSQTNINAKIIKELSIPIPPLEKQKEIVAILDKFDTLTHSISEGLPREIALRQKQYEYYRNLLLSFPKVGETA